MSSPALPAHPDCVKIVHSFHELITTRFAGRINALCWPRTLRGNFAEVVAQLGPGEGITPLDEARLRALSLGAEGRLAVDVLLADLQLLRAHGLSPELNCIYAYPRDEEPGPVHTDVFSFHADSAPIEADTWLCTYHGAPSEALSDHEARRHVDIAETRARLLQIFGGDDGDDFQEFLEGNCYDLHYAPLPGAQPFSFGTGNLWRIAVKYPDAPVPPCIHRAPTPPPGDPPRLLLIS
jgi:hypothetical protein